MTKTQDKKKNSFWVRVYDEDLLSSIYELFGTKQYESMNDFLTKMVAIGVEKTYLTFGKRKAFSNEIAPEESTAALLKEISMRLKSIELTADDIFVMLNISEMLGATLYNLAAMQMDKEPVNRELLDSGYLSQLPTHLQSVKDQLTLRIAKKKEQK